MPEVDIQRLKDNMVRWRKKVKVYNDNRKSAIKTACGQWYSQATSGYMQPINLMEQALSIYLRLLVSQQPTVLVSTDHRELRPTANTFQLALEHLFTEIKLGNTFRRIAKAALFGVGISKVGMAPGKTVEIGGVLHDIGQPYLDHVDLDDFVADPSARRIEEAQLVGNRFQAPLDWVKDSGLFENTDKLKPAAREGGIGDTTRQADLSGKIAAGDKQLWDMIELWEVWVPRTNQIITLSMGNQATKPLRVIPWAGAESGPYDLQGFSWVESNLLPVPPVAVWRDMADLANIIMRQLGRQAGRQKTILAVDEGSREGGEAVKESSDGETVVVDNVDRIKEVKYGGIAPENQAFLIWLDQLFSRMAGNIDALGGLGPQSPTLGQDQLIGQSASARIAEMQDENATFSEASVKKLAWWFWYDEAIEIPLVKRIPGADVDIQVLYNAETREGDFLDYNFSISVGSMRKKTPEMEAARFKEWITMVAPMLDLALAQGVQVDTEVLFKMFAKYSGIKEMDELIIGRGQTSFDQQGGPVQSGRRQASQTTRRYIRENRQAPTNAANARNMMQTLMGAAPQNNAQAQLPQMQGR